MMGLKFHVYGPEQRRVYVHKSRIKRLRAEDWPSFSKKVRRVQKLRKQLSSVRLRIRNVVEELSEVVTEDAIFFSKNWQPGPLAPYLVPRL